MKYWSSPLILNSCRDSRFLLHPYNFDVLLLGPPTMIALRLLRNGRDYYQRLRMKVKTASKKFIDNQLVCMCEILELSYKEIIWKHNVSGTMGYDNWDQAGWIE